MGIRKQPDWNWQDLQKKGRLVELSQKTGDANKVGNIRLDRKMKPDKLFIVDRLKELAKTQSGLGDRLNIDRAQVTRLLDGKRRVRLDEVETIARYLDISSLEMLRVLGLKL